MAPIFIGEILVFENSAIALKFVESMGFGYRTNEDRTMDKLRDDRVLTIRTLSGMEYNISVRAQLNQYQAEKPDLNLDLWQQAIFDKWKHLLTGKS